MKNIEFITKIYLNSRNNKLHNQWQPEKTKKKKKRKENGMDIRWF